jgi:cell division cycle 2-like protein
VQTSDVSSATESEEEPVEKESSPDVPKLPPYLPAIQGCRSVEEFQWLNRIEEGTYGVVYRAKDKRSGEVHVMKQNLLTNIFISRIPEFFNYN